MGGGREAGKEGRNKKTEKDLKLPLKISNDLCPTLQHHKDSHFLRDVLSPNDPTFLQNMAFPVSEAVITWGQQGALRFPRG